MARPRKIVLKLDEEKRFSAEVFDLVRTKLAPAIGGSINLGVKLAAEYFSPRKPASVVAAEMGDAIPQIAAKFAEESNKRSTADNGRLPLNDEAQKEWDSGRWKGKLTVHGLRQKYTKEIADGVDLTKSMVDAYAAELEAERARGAELADEKPDPDSGPVKCEAPVHRGEAVPFQPTVRFRLYRNEEGGLERKKHDRGEDFIQIGNFLVVPAGGEEKAEDDRAVPYCASCREVAWEFARQNKQKLTFYTAAGARRKLGRMKETAEGQAALGDQINRAAARTFGGSGTRSQRDWRTTRRPRK